MLGAMDLEALVEAYRQGQPDARRQLAEELIRIVLPVFRGRFEEVDVDELVQETIRAVLQDLHKFENRGRGSFRAWVWRTAANRRLSHGERQGRARRRDKPLDEDELPPQDEPSSHELLHWRERLSVLREALELLDPVFRRALEHLVAGGSPEELAEQEGVKPQTIRTRASRAVAKLRKLVRERWQGSGSFFSPPSRS
jgi:RNA polymerase sigma factor (sigma-70 family)